MISDDERAAPECQEESVRRVRLDSVRHRGLGPRIGSFIHESLGGRAEPTSLFNGLNV